MLYQRLEAPRLKRLVVATGVFPLKQLYIAIYRMVLWWVARQLYKDPAIGAVYLKNGGVRGEIVPGISDLDLLIVLNDEVDLAPGSHLRLGELTDAFGQRYKGLVRWLPLLDSWVDIIPAAPIQQLAMTSFQVRYILMELRHYGGLLIGQDYIGQRVPPLPEPVRRGTLIGQNEQRWSLLCKRFIQNPPPSDLLVLNSVCYRYCCDVMRMALDFKQGETTFKRAGALRRGLALLEGEDRRLAEALIHLESRRFLGTYKGIAEHTKNFLLRQYDQTYKRLANQAYAQPLKELSHHLDYRTEDDDETQADQHLLKGLLAHVDQQWGEQLLGAYVVSSVFFPVGSRLLLLQVPPDHLPSLAQLAALDTLHQRLQKQVPRQVHLLLLLPHMACCLNTDVFYGSNSPYVLPQLLAGDPFGVADHWQRPEGYPVWSQSRLTANAACFFWGQRLRHRQLLEVWRLDEGDPLAKVQQWWKWLQLEVIHRGIEAGVVHYPLTVPAIERGLRAVGLEKPRCLQGMVAAYWRGLAGDEVGIGSLWAPAQDYVRQVDPHGHRFSGPPPWLR